MSKFKIVNKNIDQKGKVLRSTRLFNCFIGGNKRTLDEQFASGMAWKGVAAALPTSGAKVGDVYKVSSTVSVLDKINPLPYIIDSAGVEFERNESLDKKISTTQYYGWGSGDTAVYSQSATPSSSAKLYDGVGAEGATTVASYHAVYEWVTL